MGFLGDILKKVKKTYQTVDTKLGGNLPGGQTPAQVKATPTTQLGSPVFKPTETTAIKSFESQTGRKANVPTSIPAGNIQEALKSSGGGTLQRPIPQETVSTTNVPSQAVSTGIRQGNTLTDEELSQIPIDQRPKMINSITGKEMLAPQLTEEEASPGSAYNLKATATSVAGGLGAAAIPAILSTASTALASLQSYFTSIGTLARTPGGAKQIVSKIPEAAGIAPKIAGAGEIVANTKNVATGLTGFISAHPYLSTLSVGFIASQATQLFSKSSDVSTKQTEFLKETGASIDLFRELGMDKEADEAELMMLDLQSGLDELIRYIPFGFGAGIKINELEGYKRIVDESIRKANQIKKDKVEQEIVDERTYKEQQEADKMIQDEINRDEQRAYNEQQQEEQRRYNEELRDEQRAYDEAQAAKAAEAALGAEAIATEGTGGSTLSFGLLSTGGDIQYVDRDKAAQFYFGKVFEELTAAQKRLLMLAKGTAQ
jgi:hypothetical protein